MQNDDLKASVGPFQFLVLGLSVYVLSALFVETLFSLSEETVRILETMDNFICGLFLIDFGVRFYNAENKVVFMKWGWIDLVSSIPMIDALRWGRAIRIMRVIRILRAARSTKFLVSMVFANRAKSALSSAVLISVLLVAFSSIAVLQVETVGESNIKNAGDAVWWAFVTITTVGYGDRFPVTFEGRLIGALLMTAGVGLFGIFTGFVASWFMGEGEKKEPTSEVEALKMEIEKLRAETVSLRSEKREAVVG